MTDNNTMTVALIVAMSRNGVIGRDNQLPWHLPGDLKFFKSVTIGKPVIMGRKTFESIGRPLPGRTNIVVTRQADYPAHGIRVVPSLNDGLRIASEVAVASQAGEIMVIGGGQLYAQALPFAQRIYVTRVHAEIDGDAFFPVVDWRQFRLVSAEHNAAVAPNPYSYSFECYARINCEC